MSNAIQFVKAASVARALLNVGHVRLGKRRAASLERVAMPLGFAQHARVERQLQPFDGVGVGAVVQPAARALSRKRAVRCSLGARARRIDHVERRRRR